MPPSAARSPADYHSLPAVLLLHSLSVVYVPFIRSKRLRAIRPSQKFREKHFGTKLLCRSCCFFIISIIFFFWSLHPLFFFCFCRHRPSEKQKENKKRGRVRAKLLKLGSGCEKKWIAFETPALYSFFQYHFYQKQLFSSSFFVLFLRLAEFTEENRLRSSTQTQ